MGKGKGRDPKVFKTKVKGKTVHFYKVSKHEDWKPHPDRFGETSNRVFFHIPKKAVIVITQQSSDDSDSAELLNSVALRRRPGFITTREDGTPEAAQEQPHPTELE